jgi:type IV secretion system protein VirB10
MSEDKPHGENHSNPDLIEGDRDIPGIAQSKDLSKIMAVAICIIGGLAILFIALDGMKKEQPQSLIEPDKQLTRITSSSMSEPYIEEARADPLLPTVPPPRKENTPSSAMEVHMAQEAIRRAREAEAERQTRIASPQIVFDRKASTPYAVSEAQILSENHLPGPNDPNLVFANQYKNQDTEMATATQMHNLDSLIAQGTMIEGILETAIQSDLPGMIRGIVSENIYSFDSSRLLIPKGTRLIGRYNAGLVRGQSRIFVIWNRLIRPDGVSVHIDSFGTDHLGRAGLGGFVDTRFFERFGSSVMLSMIDTGLQIGVNALDNDNTASIALNTGNDFSRAAEIALQNSIAIKPTVHVHQGTHIKVFVGKDLDFSTLTRNSSFR